MSRRPLLAVAAHITVTAALYQLVASAQQPAPEQPTVTPAPASEGPAGVTPPTQPEAAGAASSSAAASDEIPPSTEDVDAKAAAAAKAKEATAGAAADVDAKAAVKTAEATATPLLGTRGGTLGFPGTGAPGVVAALKLQGGKNESTKLEVLAQIGQLRLAEGIALDIVTEQVSLDLPSVTYTPSPDRRPLLKLADTSLTSAGFRVRFTTGPGGPSPEQKRELSGCLGKAGLQGVPEGEVEVCTKIGVKLTKAPTQEERIAHYTDLEDKANEGLTVTVGGRFLYRSEDVSGNAPGAAAELTPEYAFARGAAFLSGSILWLSDSMAVNDDVVSVTSELVELRTTAGLYFRFNTPVGSTQVAPRVGLYGSYSTNSWQNQFAVPGTERDIRGHQLEAGLFASGQFIGGFNGLIQFSVREPYGPDSSPQLLVTVVPSLGTDTGDGS